MLVTLRGSRVKLRLTPSILPSDKSTADQKLHPRENHSPGRLLLSGERWDLHI